MIFRRTSRLTEIALITTVSCTSSRPLYRHLPAHTHATMLPQHLTTTSISPPYQPDSAPASLSVVPLPSPRTLQLQHTRAVRRGAASCRAVLCSCPVTAAARIVTAEPSSAAERRRRCNPTEVCATQPAAAAVADVRTPATPFVALSASAVRRAGVRPTGRAEVRCPGDRCPRDRRDPGVRTDRRPVSAAAASALSTPRWIPNVGAPGQATVGAPVRRVAVVPSGLVVAARSGPGGEGWSNVGSAWPARGSTAGLGRRFARAQAAAPRSPPGRPRELVQRQGAGPLARGAREEHMRTSPSRVPPGQVVSVMLAHGAGPGGGGHAAWSLCWCWSHAVQLWRAYSVRRGQPAAAARPQHARRAVH
jgi:hypothetical protein